MSAEETELTFIRCPSCRSLVPAVATRCRMCGHQFEKKSAAAEQENVEEISKKENMDSSATRPRVRQRTMSSDSKQVSEIKEQLKVNLEQPEEESEKEVNVEKAFISKPDWRQESDFKNEDIAEYVGIESVVEEKKNTASIEKSYSFDQPSSSSLSLEQENIANKQKEKAEIVEKNLAETKAAVLSPEIPKSVEVGTKAAKIPAQTKKVDMETKTETQFENFTTASNGKKSALENTLNKEVVVENDGQLFGWLIAFGNDSRGAASEVRAGKFFIARQKLRSADMLVPDSSVSTPHCMVTASSETGLLVQDLLSEKGTFYKKAGSQNYVQVTHLIELNHGDWLKFGDYEVMVCLVPYEKNKKK